MRRIKKITLILFFIMLFVPLTKVNAATCANVKEAVNNLKEIESSYIENSCDEATTDFLIAKCNDLAVRKSATLKQIFEYNANKTCPSINLTSTVEKYSDVCTDELNSELRTLVDTVMKFFYITAPFILVIFGSLDFFKIMVGNPSEIKKHRTNFIKRVIAFLLLYTTPFFVKTIFSITPYNIDTTTYICSQEISFTPKVTSEALSGTYDPSGSGDGSDGKKIAEAAKAIKTEAIKNNYTWGCNGGGPAKQGTSAYDRMCCAEVLGAALYKSGILDKSAAKEYQTASAPGLANILKKKGWKLITNAKDLKPGDVLFYQKLKNAGSATAVNIKGEMIHTCHTDIYYGDGKKVSTGSFLSKNPLSTFSVNSECYDVPDKFRYAFRYPGKK